jgi:hypothetical protein
MDNLQDFMNQHVEWSDKTFDNGNFRRTRSISILHHLKKEVDEAISSLEEFFQHPTVDNLTSAKEEIADCFTLICDASVHLGFNADELICACYLKLEENKKRTWGKPDKNGVVQHIKN